jgi:hypothetical protein
MKQFIARLSLFAPVVLLIIAVNVIFDPARIFKSKDYERKLAHALMSGFAVTNLENVNFDDRTMERFMIQSLKEKKDIAVLGSSRVMLISSKMFPGKTLINNGLSSAALEDYISLYEIYREGKVLPSTIIIGADPWVFNKNNGSLGWQRLGQSYYSKFINATRRDSFTLKIKPEDLVPYTLQQLISVSYFQDGLYAFFTSDVHLFFKKQEFLMTKQEFNDKDTILPDGSWIFSKKHRDISTAEVRNAIKEDTDEARCIHGFFELNKGLKLKFIDLIRLMQNDGVRLILYLPPYHPYAYDYYMHSDQYKIIQDVENFLRKTSETYGLTLVGSYNPHRISIPDSAFSDEIHLRDDTELKRMFAPLLMQPGLIR